MSLTARGRVLVALGWSVASLTLCATAASLLLLVLNRNALTAEPGQPLWLSLLGQVGGPVVSVLIVSVLGALVVTRHPTNWLGWTWSATELALGLTLLCQEYAVHGLVVAPGTLPGAAAAAWLQEWLFDLLPLLVLLGLLLFPDGLLPCVPWRLMAAAGLAVTALAVLDSFANPYPLSTFVREQDGLLPVTMPPGLWNLGLLFAGWSGGAVYWAQALMVPAGGIALMVRFRGSAGEQRQQFKWVLYAVALAAGGWILGYAADLPRPAFVSEYAARAISAWGGLVWLLGITIATPVAAAVAVLKYRLYSIDRVINRTLLLGGLAAFVTAVYVAVVAGIGSALGSSFGPALSLAATAIVAVAFAPVRARLQMVADRLVYGHRATPYEVLADFAERIGGVELDEDVLPRMARLVQQGTGSERTEVWLRVGSELRLAAAWPERAGVPPPLPITDERLPEIGERGRVLPVEDAGELFGALIVAQAPGERLTPIEDKLLLDLARQAGLILRNVRLIEELRSSRARIVKAQDDERRRLERNLHDAAQQQFVTASLHVGRARGLLAAGAVRELAEELGEAAAELKSGLAELRDLARGLHPSVLTVSGLAAGLATLAERSEVPVTVECAFEGRHSLCVESTAYYLVSEALTNATRHANAAAVAVRAWAEDGWLLVEVADDGAGGADPARGSGLRGLEDRVSALGGRLRVQSPPGGGTRLLAELPRG